MTQRIAFNAPWENMAAHCAIIISKIEKGQLERKLLVGVVSEELFRENSIWFLMAEAPFVSTFIALALIPVAFFFTHAYISGKRHLPYHRMTGPVAIVWDLSLSVFYMIYRLIGGQVEGSSLKIQGALLVYFVVHGIVALVVIALEITVLSSALL
ncbi:MAG: hypothetical protein ACUVT7_00650 [Thermoplasmata archaeon]